VSGTLTNNGTIVGGFGVTTGGGGAPGVRQTGGTLNNHGSITGGSAMNASSTGSPGVVLIAGSLNNFDNIIGGTAEAGGPGAAGVSEYDATFTNTGTISGGGGGSRGGSGSPGGSGVELRDGMLSNIGDIVGGVGSNTTGGAGGTGVDVTGGSLTETGSISGGAGGTGNTIGGHGGTGVALDGGTLTTSGTIAGGSGGSGASTGAPGVAVVFGSVASTLIVDRGAVFSGKVVADAAVHDVLELSGTQSGGTAITLGTQFTNFSTLEFASDASGTVDATKGALSVAGHALTIDGFALGDTLDITNLTAKGTTQNFNSTTDVLTLTHVTTVINLDFDSGVSGDHFVLSANGTGTDLTLASGADATLAAATRDLTNFVSSDLGLLANRFLLGANAAEYTPTLTAAVMQEPVGFALAAQAGIHGLAHTTSGCAGMQ
jgi:hypothetical protein